MNPTSDIIIRICLIEWPDVNKIVEFLIVFMLQLLCVAYCSIDSYRKGYKDSLEGRKSTF